MLQRIFESMKQSRTDTILVEGYVSLIASLSPENRTAIISRLEALPVKDVQKEKTAFQESFGAFESEETAEELIKMIRESRTSTRKTESF